MPKVTYKPSSGLVQATGAGLNINSITSIATDTNLDATTFLTVATAAIANVVLPATADTGAIKVIIADTDATAQVLEFVNYKQELFKINDIYKDKDIYIIFQVVVNNSIAQEIFLKFNYRLSNNTGDVNGDGVIDLRDLVALSDHVSNIKTALKPEFADTNGDGVVNLFDVVELSRRIING